MPCPVAAPLGLHQHGVFVAVFGRGDADVLAEMTAEVGGVGVTRFVGNFAHLQSASAQQTAGFFHPEADEVVDGAVSGVPAKKGGEMVWTDKDKPRKIFKSGWLGKVVLQVLNDGDNAFRVAIHRLGRTMERVKGVKKIVQEGCFFQEMRGWFVAKQPAEVISNENKPAVNGRCGMKDRGKTHCVEITATAWEPRLEMDDRDLVELSGDTARGPLNIGGGKRRFHRVCRYAVCRQR